MRNQSGEKVGIRSGKKVIDELRLQLGESRNSMVTILVVRRLDSKYLTK